MIFDARNLNSRYYEHYDGGGFMFKMLVIWTVFGFLSQSVVGLLACIRTIRIELENDIELPDGLEPLKALKNEDSEILRFNPFRNKVNCNIIWVIIANIFGFVTWPVYDVLAYRDFMRAIDNCAIQILNEKLNK